MTTGSNLQLSLGHRQKSSNPDSNGEGSYWWHLLLQRLPLQIARSMQPGILAFFTRHLTSLSRSQPTISRYFSALCCPCPGPVPAFLRLSAQIVRTQFRQQLPCITTTAP
jgi:hypothetical protein